LCAGDYLLVWGNGEPHSGYYDAELLDGRRGLVPASFVQRLVGKYDFTKNSRCLLCAFETDNEKKTVVASSILPFTPQKASPISLSLSVPLSIYL